ncbi:bifunctional nicotinamidase/pyrazinamidase [Aquabacter sp. L1I39]|uniref:bifunctional nicotinamidase/pyrazinamidase n=1 Tax=Aquabacter sp. L1I39 TaxID=2820278 RepID=UPI001ADBCB5B|nr:bifunctional nicotinamidase/pyrazinamidase [Aquabacter sp. L1I39]QTL03873.1 bifunctional nicotinamidase/pyrazinamidase [Aquabacter sp. L1I39]
MRATSSIGENPRVALLLVDLQVDFLPGGSLAVAGGDEVVPLANRVASTFRNVILTQDWHPAGHVSFATSHPGRAPFEVIDLPYGPQVLWPDHCVQGTAGAAFAPGLDVPHAHMIVRKGVHAGIDSYSTFYEADRVTPTGLTGALRDRGIDHVCLMGLATDFCVAWSAVDAARHRFRTQVILDGCRAIDANGSLARAQADMAAAGVELIGLADL